MRNMSSKAPAAALAATLVFGAVSFVAAPPAQALPVYCTNCSTVFSQATQVAKEIEIAITTAEQLSTQIKQYQDMILQGANLSDSVFGQLTGDLQRLQSLYQDSKGMAGQLSGFDQQFRARYGDYNSYLNQSGKNPDYMSTKYKKWSEESFDSMRTAMRSSGMNVSAIADEDKVLAQIVTRSQNAQGRMQAIQAGNEIAAQQVQQLQKLRLMLNDQVQSQSTWYAQAIERQTVDDAYEDQISKGQIKNSGGKDF